jgi:hypothetical protein
MDEPKDQAGEERRRPNAGYTLSSRKVNEDEITFYYNRERRLAKAPQAVRDLYREEKPRRFGLLAPLIGSKPRAMMFGSIVLICAAMLILSIFGYTSDTHELDGNQLAVRALRYEGALMLELQKTVKKGGLFGSAQAAYSGAVDIAVAPALREGAGGGGLPVFSQRIFFTLEPKEAYRFALPFDAEALALVFQTEQKSLSITARVVPGE